MKNKAKFSRRQFLRSSGTTLALLFGLPFFNKVHGIFRNAKTEFPAEAESLGRVSTGSIILYDKPSEKARYIKTLARDTVLPITQYVIGESSFLYNRIWFELDGQGFAHSGFVQPVQNRQNLPASIIPPQGMLCEVSVPFTNGVLNPAYPNSLVYRLYYGSTYWVNRIVTDSKDKHWYRIVDEEGYLFYVEASHLKVLTAADLETISPDVAPDMKRIEVHLQEQKVIAFENNRPVFMTRAATGAIFRTGNFLTPQGQFITNRKRPSRHMMDPFGSSYDLPGVPWVCYVNDKGVAFHGTYWHNNFGAPRSHGCINLSNDAAKWLYRWTTPHVPIDKEYHSTVDGTHVDIW